MFYTHKHSNYAVTHPLCNYMFQALSLLHWQVRNASDADISLIFL